MSDPLTFALARLAEIEARCEAATPGPWRVLWETHVMGGADVDRLVAGCGSYENNYEPDLPAKNAANAAHVAAARTDLPALVRALREVLERHHKIGAESQSGWCAVSRKHGSWPCRCPEVKIIAKALGWNNE